MRAIKSNQIAYNQKQNSLNFLLIQQTQETNLTSRKIESYITNAQGFL